MYIYEQIAISSAAMRLEKAFLDHCRVQIPGDYALSNLSDFVQPVTADDVLPSLVKNILYLPRRMYLTEMY
jgi:hypothetical protein